MPRVCWVHTYFVTFDILHHFIVHVSEYYFTSLSAQLSQYRDRRKPEVDYALLLSNEFKGYL